MFFDDFFKSIDEQDDKDFEVLLINDGVENLEDYLKNYPEIQFSVLDYTNTPAKIRERGLELLRQEGYEYIVFADSDDYFSNNRVSVSKNLLMQYDLVASEIVIVDQHGDTIEPDYFSNRISDCQIISRDYLIDKNIFGLGNSAIKGSLLKPITIPQELVAVDWFIFSNLMVGNTKAIFSNAAKCYYRQHHNNAIGFTEITPERLKKSIKNKLLHYKAMSSEHSEYEAYYKLIEETETYIKHNFDTYYNKINNLNLDHPLWWEEAKTLKDLNL